MICLAALAYGQLAARGLTLARLGIFAVKQSAQLQAYGLLPGVFELWIQESELADEPVRASISRFSGVLTVCAAAGLSDAELDELRDFLCRIGGNRLEGEESLLVRLGIANGALLSFEMGWAMRCSLRQSMQISAPAPACAELEITRAEMLEPVYHLLFRSDSHFREWVRYDAWLTDFSHRCRKQLSECYILKADGEIISTASILYIDGKTALVGGVATDPAHRGQGHARRLMAYLAALAQQRELELWLLSADEQLADFYRSCGWENQARWVSRALAPV